MSYEAALRAAGANVLNFDQFGSYQGDWWAKVEFAGKAGWVHGWYGSCSGCDAFEREFGYDFSGEFVDGNYIEPGDERHPRHAEYMSKLKAFGANYLDNILPQEKAEEEASENLSWDLDAGTALTFLRKHAIGGE